MPIVNIHTLAQTSDDFSQKQAALCILLSIAHKTLHNHRSSDITSGTKKPGAHSGITLVSHTQLQLSFGRQSSMLKASLKLVAQGIYKMFVQLERTDVNEAADG